MKLFKQCMLVFLGGVFALTTAQAKFIVAIDAGHGGHDSGSIGRILKIKEKDVSLAIARHLKAALDADPNFKAVMTRNEDKYVGVVERSEIARKMKANYLISIHADSYPLSTSVSGISVRILNNKRVNQDLDDVWKDKKKQSELLGGVGELLSKTNDDYLGKAMVDMQFSHAQKQAYALSNEVLAHFSKFHQVKRSPVPQDLGVLSAPDIPSILVESGFLTNEGDEQRLSTDKYRKQIANAIYQGLVAHTKKVKNSRPQTNYKVEKSSQAPEKIAQAVNKSNKTATPNTSKSSETKAKNTQPVTESKHKQQEVQANYHIVEQDQTLYSIARMYQTTPEKLSKLNNIKENKIFTGQKLKLK